MTSTSPRARSGPLRLAVIVCALLLAVTACAGGEDSGRAVGRATEQSSAPSTPAGSLTRSAPTPSQDSVSEAEVVSLQMAAREWRSMFRRYATVCGPDGRELGSGLGNCSIVLTRLGLGTPDLVEAWRAERPNTEIVADDGRLPARFGVGVTEDGYLLLFPLGDKEAWNPLGHRMLSRFDAMLSDVRG